MTTCIGMQPSRSASERLGTVVRSPAKVCLALLVTVVLLLFATGTAMALSCVGPERLLFPPPGDIPPNPVFVLQLDGATGDPIRGLPVVSSDISFTGGHSRAHPRTKRRHSRLHHFRTRQAAAGRTNGSEVASELRRAAGGMD